MKKYTYKNWSALVLVLISLLIIIVAAFNYLVDPLQFYHKAFYTPVYSDEQRYQLPGLAKNLDYDTIIIGSSMTENFLPSYIKKRLGFDTLKLSISGSSAREQYLIANIAIKSGKVKNVIWGIDYFALRGEPYRVRDDQGPFPFYLYDSNPLKSFKYLLNIDTTIDSNKIILDQLILKNVQESDIDLLYTWHDEYEFSRETVLNKWNEFNTDTENVSREYEINNIEKNLQENVFKLIRENPDVNFYLYHPPYSILQHFYYYKINRLLFENELHVKRIMFEELGTLGNVRIYDFQQIKDITFELDNYKDLAHHTKQINDYIIDSIAANEYLVTEDVLDTYLQMLNDQVATLKVEDL
jgi:hypothetical protein